MRESNHQPNQSIHQNNLEEISVDTISEMEGNVNKRKNEDQIFDNNKRRSIKSFEKIFPEPKKDKFLMGFFELTLEWILKAILEEDEKVKTSTRDISNAVLQSFSPGELLEKNYLLNFYGSFHETIIKVLTKMFPHQKESWNLKVNAINIIPQNMNIHWIHYFASMSSRGYKIEDLVNAPEEEEDDDDSFFEEVILQKTTTEKRSGEHEKSNTIKGYSEVSSKWKTFDPKLLLKSIESLGKIKTSKTGKVRTPPGAQSSSSTAKTSIDKVVTFIKDLFAGDLNFAFQVLSLNEQFKSCLLSFVEENKLELVSELNDVKKEYENLKQSIVKVEEVYRDNIQIIYNSFSFSKNELDHFISYLRKLVKKVTSKELASKIVPRSISTCYRIEQNNTFTSATSPQDFSTKLNNSILSPGKVSLDPFFIQQKNEKLSLFVKPPKHTKNKNKPPKINKKKNLTEKEKKKKEKRKLKEEKKKKEKEEREKVQATLKVKDDINKFLSSYD